MSWLALFVLLFSFLGVAQDAPKNAYEVPPLDEKSLPTTPAVTRQGRVISLTTENGSPVFISEIRQKNPNGSFSALDASKKRAIEQVIASTFKGECDPLLVLSENRLYFKDLELSLSFAVRTNSGITANISPQEPYFKSYCEQLSRLLGEPRPEALRNIANKKLYFAFLIDGRNSDSEDENAIIAREISTLLSGNLAPQLSLNEKGIIIFDNRPITIFFYFDGPSGLKEVADTERLILYSAFQRHSKYVLKKKTEEMANSPLRFPANIRAPLESSPQITELKKAQSERLERLTSNWKSWQNMMDFMSAESPRVAKRIKAEVDRLQVQLDPVDTFSYSQSKVRPQHVLVTELVVNENGVIRIANNFFSGYEEADKTTLVLYGVLKGIPSFSDKGAFDLASKIKMMTQYDVGASNKPNPVGKEEFEQAVLSSIQDRELQQWDQWIRETQALRKQYQTAENHGEPATIFLESLKETEAKIKTKRFELSQKLFDRIFPNN